MQSYVLKVNLKVYLKVSETIRISYGLCQMILNEDLGIKHALDKFVP
jgi:hypothetical protein